MSAAAHRCASCGSGADADAKFCWLCGYPLAPSAALAPPAEPVGAPPLDAFVWVGGFVLALFVMLGVAIELALLWPGLLVPYALVLVPVVAVMARIVYVQRFDFWRDRRPAESGSTAAPDSGDHQDVDTRNRGDGASFASGSDMLGEVATAIAIGLGAVMVVVGLLMLLAVAAFVILIAICLGMMAAYQ